MITACVCTNNPKPDVFRECLAGLRRQEIPGEGLELVVIDNGSQEPLTAEGLGLGAFPYPARLVREDRLGLTHARVRGAAEARGGIIVFVDDDNFLEPDYLAAAARLFAAHPRAGAAGGCSRPRWAEPPPAWLVSMESGLALRDLGSPARCISGEAGASLAGAGLALRLEALRAALQTPLLLEDRKGKRLTSGGDTELMVRIALLGWETWYDPAMRLEHFIFAQRMRLEYLTRLHFGFGVAMGSIDLYSGYLPPLASFWYLRRAFYHRRQAWAHEKQARRLATEAEQAPVLIRAAFDRGRATGLAGLAFTRKWRSQVAPFLPSQQAAS